MNLRQATTVAPSRPVNGLWVLCVACILTERAQISSELLVVERLKTMSREELLPSVSVSSLPFEEDVEGDVSEQQQCSCCTSKNLPQYSEPIVVGYAFGAKKMSTMGVVMAEASRVKVIYEEPEAEEAEEDDQEYQSFGNDPPVDERMADEGSRIHESLLESDAKAFSENENPDLATYSSALTQDALQGLESSEQEGSPEANESFTEPRPAPIFTLERSVGNTTPPPTTTTNTITHSKLDSHKSSDLRDIVRYFRSNCSSTAGDSIASICMSETSGSTSGVISLNNSYTTTDGVMTPGISSNASTTSSRRRRQNTTLHPKLISFVPLDPDQPIQDQHGGNFDLILHKLTEDILSCSLQPDEEDDLDDPSWKRIQALQEYHRNNHRKCCLVDNPRNVQTVMSRSDIAHVLQNCLSNVRTTSGIPVRAPKFVVLPECSDDACSRERRTEHLCEALREQGIETPLIVKPLIAAGTKQSHFMLIALQGSAFDKLPNHSCLVQEYVNHNARLYKVYVLGGDFFVSVYERHSLPDLPSKDVLSEATTDLVEFDSQRPYPKLSDFGLDNVDTTTGAASTWQGGVAVTVEEVIPIVNALKQAFGLELFGFDILKRSQAESCGSVEEEWLVVDVNYFPSYKEVPNFPSLLARYLTKRVLEQRRKSRVVCQHIGS